jgi:hypothetical protein
MKPFGKREKESSGSNAKEWRTTAIGFDKSHSFNKRSRSFLPRMSFHAFFGDQSSKLANCFCLRHCLQPPIHISEEHVECLGSAKENVTGKSLFTSNIQLALKRQLVILPQLIEFLV